MRVTRVSSAGCATKGLGEAPPSAETVEVSANGRRLPKWCWPNSCRRSWSMISTSPPRIWVRLERRVLTLFESGGGRPQVLEARLQHMPVGGPLLHLLNSIRTANDLTDACNGAIRWRQRMSGHPDGVRVGHGWVIVQRGSDARAGCWRGSRKIGC